MNGVLPRRAAVPCRPRVHLYSIANKGGLTVPRLISVSFHFSICLWRQLPLSRVANGNPRAKKKRQLIPLIIQRLDCLD